MQSATPNASFDLDQKEIEKAPKKISEWSQLWGFTQPFIDPGFRIVSDDFPYQEKNGTRVNLAPSGSHMHIANDIFLWKILTFLYQIAFGTFHWSTLRIHWKVAWMQIWKKLRTQHGIRIHLAKLKTVIKKQSIPMST